MTTLSDAVKTAWDEIWDWTAFRNKFTENATSTSNAAIAEAVTEKIDSTLSAVGGVVSKTVSTARDSVLGPLMPVILLLGGGLLLFYFLKWRISK